MFEFLRRKKGPGAIVRRALAAESVETLVWLGRQGVDLAKRMRALRLGTIDTELAALRPKIDGLFADPATRVHIDETGRIVVRLLQDGLVRRDVDRLIRRSARWLEVSARRVPGNRDFRTRLARVAEKDAMRAFWVVFGSRDANSDQTDHPVARVAREAGRAYVAMAALKRPCGPEERSRRAVTALGAVCEGPYKEYVRMRWRLACAESGVKLRDQDVLARMVERVDTAYPGLLDPDYRYMRNAAAHGHSRYDATSDSLTLWNEKPSGARDWTLTLPVDAVIARVEFMFVTAGGNVMAARGTAVRVAAVETGLVASLLEVVAGMLRDSPQVTNDKLEAVFRAYLLPR